jgi:hypothetical protein
MPNDSSSTQPTAQQWWARVAYGCEELPAATAALKASGLLLKPLVRPEALMSAMARGDALMKGARKITPEKAKRKKPSAEYLRTLQWRLVMSYAGFEIFVKSITGRLENGNGGIDVPTLEHLLSLLTLPPFQPLPAPRRKSEAKKWLCETGSAVGDRLGDFLQLNPYDRKIFLEYLNGSSVDNYMRLCLLAKAVRNATAHGFLSPTKCETLGLTKTIQAIPVHLDSIRMATVEKISAFHPISDRH